MSNPPQTYCRLFRPWDGKSHQDSTITSTSSTNNSEIVVNNSKIIEDDKNCAKPLICDKQQFKCESNEFFADPFTTLDKIQQAETMAFYAKYPEFANSSCYMPSPYMGMDSFSASVMDQEYARVLAEEAQAKMLSSRKQRPKKFKCPHCDVAFSNNGQLKGHVRIHTGERPFVCDDKNCGKSFTRNEELTRHKRIHTGLRPYACVTCGKRFGRRDHLKKHTKTHFIQERYLPQTIFLPLYPYLYGM